ncbi:hypothetical protein EN829_069800, partial [Mesorhizobium sp. M00.F.Ca.ET.186.01.1.1]
IRLAFSRNKFTESSMQRFLGNFQRHLGEIILHGSQHGAKEFTPSDFDTVELTQEELDNLFI